MAIFYMLIGCHGSGKSTYAAKHSDCTIVNLDDIHKELYGTADIPTSGRYVAQIGKRRLLSALSLGENVIYDACNAQRCYRQRMLSQLPKEVEKVAVYFNVPLEICLQQNENRERPVQKEVIERMHSKLPMPLLSEGFDRIVIFNRVSDNS